MDDLAIFSASYDRKFCRKLLTAIRDLGTYFAVNLIIFILAVSTNFTFLDISKREGGTTGHTVKGEFTTLALFTSELVNL